MHPLRSADRLSKQPQHDWAFLDNPKRRIARRALPATLALTWQSSARPARGSNLRQSTTMSKESTRCNPIWHLSAFVRCSEISAWTPCCYRLSCEGTWTDACSCQLGEPRLCLKREPRLHSLSGVGSDKFSEVLSPPPVSVHCPPSVWPLGTRG